MAAISGAVREVKIQFARSPFCVLDFPFVNQSEGSAAAIRLASAEMHSFCGIEIAALSNQNSTMRSKLPTVVIADPNSPIPETLAIIFKQYGLQGLPAASMSVAA